MGNRLTKIYTKTGDDGSTGLGDGSRVSKHNARVEAYGTVDETNSAIGVVLSCENVPDLIRGYLANVQHDLFDLGSELCIPGHEVISSDFILRLESYLDNLNKELPALKEFVLPGGNPAAAQCHLARTIARRAERRVSELMQKEDIRIEVLRYLNRLSDLLFVVARFLNQSSNNNEVLWDRKKINDSK